MAEFTFLVVNGPNLGAVGRRQPSVYGQKGFEALPDVVSRLLGDREQRLAWQLFQSNHEGALIDRLEQAVDEPVDGLVLNAGALTHTSLALADCLAWIDLPCVEVHLSNVWSRSEPLRQSSLTARHCIGVITGFGLTSYALALLALLEHLTSRTG
jgi:3-dehydroquinate dehydratase-2